MNLSYENVDKLNSKASKNTVTLRFIGRGYYEGFTCLLSDGVTIDYEINYVSIFNLTYKQIAYNAAHETWHQIYNKAQLFYNHTLIHEGTGHHDNSVNNLNRAASYDSEMILPYQNNIVNPQRWRTRTACAK